jgi:L-threonylcarbamoyladenylate synthase
VEQPEPIDAELIARASALLRGGGLVAFPTETVYGLGADATSAAALERLFAVKGRPRSHPLIVHLGDASWLDRWVRDVPEAARRLAARYWPGPLTMILPRAARVPDAVTGGQDTVGVRVPRHPVALALLEAFDGAIAAPSANRFGRVSPTTAAHVAADLGADVDLVLDGGPCEVGIESTIVDLSRARPVLLRPGRITADEIADATGLPLDDARRVSAPRAPGTLEAHYAPRTPLAVRSASALARGRPAPGRVAVLAFARPAWAEARDVVRIASPTAAQYAHDLYAILRELDLEAATKILVEAPPHDAEWTGVADRLLRASHGSGA